MKFSKKSLDRMTGLHPDLVRVLHRAIQITRVDFGISQGVRTLEQQKELYAQGRTKPGKIVTWTMNSKHLPQADGYGHAFDVVAYVHGEVSWVESFYITIAEDILNAAQQVGVALRWGGTFRDSKGDPNPDYPHFELVKKQ
jgi:peptidoglycan LD-endopeptidase CwlK